MSKSTVSKSAWKKVLFMGVDLGDKKSHVCGLDREGNVVVRTKVSTKSGAFAALPVEPCRIAIEVGTHSRWISQELESVGFEVYVANARQLKIIYQSNRKNDAQDAESLARLVRLDPKLLKPIRHRSNAEHYDLQVIKTRDTLVRSRTMMIVTVRGLVKSVDGRLASCSAESFCKTLEQVPEEVRMAVEPLYQNIELLNASIKELDKKVEELCNKYPVTHKLRKIQGVGPLTALAFLLTIADPKRFARSRTVGSWLGLTPKQDQSGDIDKRLGITKAGDVYMRRLLVSCAQYILGRFGEDSDLRRHGLAIAARGGPTAKKKAVIAVARKLAVLMHSMWTKNTEYDKDRNLSELAVGSLSGLSEV